MRAPRPLHLEDTSAGPDAGTLIARIADLPDHGGKEVVFRDGHHIIRLLVQRIGDQILVYENRCPHAGTPLNLFDDKFLNIDGSSLICRTHGALFDPQTGHCHLGPCKGQYLRSVAVDVRDGAIYSA